MKSRARRLTSAANSRPDTYRYSSASQSPELGSKYCSTRHIQKYRT